MDTNKSYLFFTVERLVFAIPIKVVQQCIQIIEILPVPDFPQYISGIINILGEVIPVIHLRILFGLSEKEIELSDQMIIVTSRERSFALLVDSVSEIKEIMEEEVVKFEMIKYGKKYVSGVIKLEDGMVLINNVDLFLDENELKELENAIHLHLEPEQQVN